MVVSIISAAVFLIDFVLTLLLEVIIGVAFVVYSSEIGGDIVVVGSGRGDRGNSSNGGGGAGCCRASSAGRILKRSSSL